MNTRRRLLFATLALAATTGLFAFMTRESAQDSASLRLEVQITTRTLTVVENGEPTRTYEITVGKPGHPTPVGSYRITWLEWNPSWHPPDSPWARGKTPVDPGPGNPMGRVKMFFRSPAYYIHGTAAEAEMGRAASHGCVRLRNEDVIELAQLVMEHGGQPRPPSWFQRVINRFRDTEQVRLSAPVPLEIRAAASARARHLARPRPA